MGTVTAIRKSKFSVGDLIHHRLFDYRGVIVDIDAAFQLTDEWYEAVAKSRPPKDEPWYMCWYMGRRTRHMLRKEISSATRLPSRLIIQCCGNFFPGLKTGGISVPNDQTNLPAQNQAERWGPLPQVFVGLLDATRVFCLL